MPLLTANQLSEWILYEKLEPFGYPETELQNSYTRRTIVESMGGKRKGGGHWSNNDFSIEYAREEGRKQTDRKRADNQQTQSVEEMKRILMTVARNQNKERVLHNRPPVRKE